MKVLIAGGSGFIGTQLARVLIARGDEVIILTRRMMPQTGGSIRFMQWDARSEGTWLSDVEGMDAWVNLVGENLASGRWTQKRKASIRSSRVESGKVLAQAVMSLIAPPKVFVQASAIGIYGTSLTERFSEKSEPGQDFLARLAVEWEASTQPVEAAGVRRVVIRTGVVLDKTHGALPPMVLQARLFSGGPLGSGSQWLSWIHIDDEVGAILHLMDNASCKGAYNLTAPTPATNATVARAICQNLKRPYWFRVPSFLLKAAVGEMATLLLDGQCVLPENLQASGYKYRYDSLEKAVQDLLH